MKLGAAKENAAYNLSFQRICGTPLRYTPQTAEFCVHGGSAAVNRGADYVKYLVPSLRARTRCLTGHRGPHRDYEFYKPYKKPYYYIDKYPFPTYH